MNTTTVHRPSRRSIVAAAALGLAAVASAAGTAAASSAPSGPSGETIRIGLLTPESGPYELLGTELRQGFDTYLALHDNQLGGHPVEIVRADEGANPETARTGAERLVREEGVVAVTGVVSSGSAAGIADLFDESQVPLIISNAGANDLLDSSDFLFRTSFRNRVGDYAAGQFLAEQVPDGVFVIGADYAAGHEHIGGFIDGYTEGGGEIVGEVYTPFGTTTDFQPYLNDIQNSGASAVYAFYAGGEAISFLQQFKEFGLDASIQLYGYALTSEEVIEAQGDAAVGVQSVTWYTPSLDNPTNEAFVEHYTETYGSVPTIYSAQSYDSAGLLDAALASIDGDVTSDSLTAALAAVEVLDSPRGEITLVDRDVEQAYYMIEAVEGDDGLVNEITDELGVYPVDS